MESEYEMTGKYDSLPVQTLGNTKHEEGKGIFSFFVEIIIGLHT